MKDLFFLNEEILSYEKIIIYGLGVAGKGVLLKLLQRNVRVECFADSDPEKCGTRYLNIPVVHIDDLIDVRETAAVIVCGGHAFNIAVELEKRGFRHLFLDYANEAGILHLEKE
jgi:NADH/NAD ratio-sensing transcriptional regulator Rex